MALMQRYLRSQFVNSTIGEPVMIAGMIDVTAPTHSTLSLGGVSYEAVAVGPAGDAITIEYLEYIPAVAASLVVQDLTYTAATPGAAGNLITIEYTGGGTAGSEVVTVLGNDISIQIDDNVSTATQIKAAFDLSAPAVALASCAITGAGGDPQTIAAPTPLAGGQDAQGDAGNEIVTVVGDAISVRLQSGVSTITQVRTAVNASVPAAALVTATGTSATTVAAPVAATPLAGGSLGSTSDNLGNLVSSVERTGTGEYTITLYQVFKSLQFAKMQIGSGDNLDLFPQITDYDVSGTRQIVFTLLEAGTPTDLPDDAALLVNMILNRSTLI